MNQNITTHNCSQCGSPLILLKKITEKIEGSRFPQTTSTYKCSNPDCQKRRDIETAKRIKLQQEKTQATEERAAKKIQQKRTLLH
ncbi:MAG TPA: hypothetical protein VMR41_01795 [Patescibacteria group bacterium]|nr:hypothetical protein [Patescibacteria group bacterium]